MRDNLDVEEVLRVGYAGQEGRSHRVKDDELCDGRIGETGGEHCCSHRSIAGGVVGVGSCSDESYVASKSCDRPTGGLQIILHVRNTKSLITCRKRSECRKQCVCSAHDSIVITTFAAG